MDIGQIAALLGKTNLFEGLDEAARLKIARHGVPRAFPRGQTIFVQDELGERLFVLAEGVVRLVIRSRHGDVIELARHWPPAVFGEIAVLDGGPRSASAEVVEPATVISVTREQIIQLLRDDEQVVRALLTALGKMVRHANEQTSDLAFLDLQGRVAKRLLELWQRTERRNLRVTQTELAQMVRGSRQNVNLALRSLEARGYVRVTVGSVEILDPDELERRAAR